MAGEISNRKVFALDLTGRYLYWKIQSTVQTFNPIPGCPNSSNGGPKQSQLSLLEHSKMLIDAQVELFDQMLSQINDLIIRSFDHQHHDGFDVQNHGLGTMGSRHRICLESCAHKISDSTFEGLEFRLWNQNRIPTALNLQNTKTMWWIMLENGTNVMRRMHNVENKDTLVME
ncbi:hypothetical protein AC578_4655 [Pseudocercospora eumusae]|uniref:Uncharacterized protein n=1 Tax=Pseudocercospora eumusae TaxID=321146 RepID=A0A139H7E2_9PEZI|nr:hypothetical protein AC578_4655 [Pseudocercospora eumusae]